MKIVTSYFARNIVAKSIFKKGKSGFSLNFIHCAQPDFRVNKTIYCVFIEYNYFVIL